MRDELMRLLLNSPAGQTAIIDASEHFTYGQLYAGAELARGRFLRLGAKLIVIFLPNGSRFLSAFLGALRAGITVFPISPALTASELSGLLSHTKAQVVATEERYRGILEEAGAAAGLALTILTEKAPESESALIEQRVPAPDDTMLLLSTSGTTGNVKIVKLSGDNVLSNAGAYLKKVDFERHGGDSYILAAPFSSAYGIMIILAAILKGFALVTVRENETPSGMLELAKKHRVVYYEGGASMLIMLDMLLRGRAVPKLDYPKYFGFGGSRVSADIIRRLMSAYPDKEFCWGYGMTEASPLISKFSKCARFDKAESVGTPVEGETVLIRTDSGITDRPFVQGEILVRGANVTLGYFDNEAETRKTYQDGFLCTGDMGYFDDEGYLYLCGRKKNIIIVRGFNVYPEELEDALFATALVADCFVYGEQDANGSETVCADIVPVSAEVSREELLDACRPRLAPYKLPAKIRFVEKLEKTPTGKSKRSV